MVRNSTAVAARIAVSQGAPLVQTDLPCNLQEMLARSLTTAPQNSITCLRTDRSEVRFTWAELIERAERVLGSLRARGLRPGDAVILQCAEHDEGILAYWGCVLGGFVPVPLAIAPANGRTNALEKLRSVWRLLNNARVIASPHLAREYRELDMAEQLPGFAVESIDELASGSRDGRWHNSAPDETGIILFTSGSTGTPKGVVQPHRNLIAFGAAVAQMHGFRSDEVKVNWFPLDHVGGMVMSHLQGAFFADTQIHAASELILRNPLLWFDLVHHHRATWTWAPNFAFKLICDLADQVRERTWDLSCLRFLLNGGEAVVARTARRFMELMAPFGIEHCALRPAWGMSETCSGIAYATGLTPDRDDATFVEVGPPIPGVEMRIIAAGGDIASDGEIGRLQVSGETITPGYFGNAEQNLASFTPDGWFETGDLAIIRDGQLTITGRSKDLIIVNGANYYCHDIESAVEEVEGVDVTWTAACAVRRDGSDTDKVCIFFHPLSDDIVALRSSVREAVMNRIGIVPEFIVPLDREQIPKTGIGKIIRSELKGRFESGDFNHIANASMTQASVPLQRRIWTPGGTLHAAAEFKGAFLLLSDKMGVASGLEAELIRRGARIVTENDLELAAAFEPLTVVHLATFGETSADSPEGLQAAQGSGCFNLLRIAQRVLATRTKAEIRIFVVTSGSVITGDETALIQHGTIPGLLRSIAGASGIECRLIDLETGAPDNLAIILGELSGSSDREVAHRKGQRLTPAFEPIGVENGESAITGGGLYLITGGSGGIGSIVARDLIERHDARILAIGRSENHGVTNEHLLYRAVDVANLSGLTQAVREAEQHFGLKLAGIFHLAGELSLARHWNEEHGIEAESAESFNSMFHAKVYGAANLARLIEERSEVLFVLFSSVNGLFGGATLSAYSAASSFIDLFALDLRNRKQVRAYVFDWSMWENIGMTVDAPPAVRESARALGYRVLSHDEGLRSLRAGLTLPPSQIVVGLETPALRFGQEDTEDGPGDFETETEGRLAAIWADILRVERVTAANNFFHMGGDSLLAMRLLNRIEAEFGIRLRLSMLFQDATIRGLARAINSEHPTPELDPSALLERIDELPDEQVEALLTRMASGQ